jgi:hypothetical protein
VGSLCALLAVLRLTLSVAVCVECMRNDAWYIIGLTLSIGICGYGFEMWGNSTHGSEYTYRHREGGNYGVQGLNLWDQGTAMCERC